MPAHHMETAKEGGMNYNDFKMIKPIPRDQFDYQFNLLGSVISEVVQINLFGDEDDSWVTTVDLDIDPETQRLVFKAALSGGNVRWQVDVEKSVLSQTCCTSADTEAIALALEALASRLMKVIS